MYIHSFNSFAFQLKSNINWFSLDGRSALVLFAIPCGGWDNWDGEELNILLNKNTNYV